MKQKIRECQQTETNISKLAELQKQEQELLEALRSTRNCKTHVQSLRFERAIVKAKLERQMEQLDDLNENLSIYKYALDTLVGG